MKKIVFALLILTAVCSAALYAQLTTVKVTSDLTTGTEGNLNNAITAVVNSDPTGKKLSNTIFMLEANGYYILTGTITTPPHATLHIYAPAPGLTQATSLPQIAWTNSGGVTTTFSLDCYGDLDMKNIWMLCARTSGAQVSSAIVLEDDSIANLPGGKGENLWMDGCVIDYMGIGNGGGAIEPSCRHFRGHITNTYFRNMTDSHYRYYGRAVSWTYQSTTWHTDTLQFENCTFSNCGYAYMQESPEYGDYITFNHCTFANTMMFTLESTYWWWLSITNCVFVNSYMFGDIPSGDGANHYGAGGMINFDSTSTFGFDVNFTDSSTAAPSRQRHVLLANNVYSHEKWYLDFLNANPYRPAGDSDRIHRMPAMNGKTYRYFIDKNTATGKKKFPYLNIVNMYPPVDTIADLPATYNAATDPKFILNPENIDSIKAFLIGRWQSGANVNWAFDINSDIQQLWPMSEDLSFTNATFKSAGMAGFPLGDLNHWWPTKYTAWLTQAPTERATILNMLTTGTVGVNDQNQPAIPLTYELGQNYPNPFNPTTTIEFRLPIQSNLRLVLLNVLGQEVKVITTGTFSAGNHRVMLDASSLASGVYFYKLQTEKFSDVKKLMLIK